MLDREQQFEAMATAQPFQRGQRLFADGVAHRLSNGAMRPVPERRQQGVREEVQNLSVPPLWD